MGLNKLVPLVRHRLFCFIIIMNINQLFQKFDQLQVLVLGDLMIDRYQKGNVTRLSPEAPVPVVDWVKEENRLGGAANVALNVKALGGKVFLSGVVGKGVEGELFFKLLEENQIDPTLILQSSDRPTTLKTRIMAGDQQLLRLDKESRNDLNEKESEELQKRLSDFFNLHKIDLVILQDYNKGVLTKKIIKVVLSLAAEKKVVVAVDPKLNNFWEYKGVQMFKPNLKEINDNLPFEVNHSLDSLSKATTYLKEKLKCELFLVTLSEHGLFIKTNSNQKIYSAPKRKVADVCGAGDAVVAIASMAMSIGLEESLIAFLANIAGGQVVEKAGVVPIDRKQMKLEIQKSTIQKLL